MVETQVKEPITHHRLLGISTASRPAGRAEEDEAALNQHWGVEVNHTQKLSGGSCPILIYWAHGNTCSLRAQMSVPRGLQYLNIVPLIVEWGEELTTTWDRKCKQQAVTERVNILLK